MVDEKQNSHLYAGRDDLKPCGLSQGASGLPDLKPFLILREICSQCSGIGGNYRLLYGEKYLVSVMLIALRSQAHAHCV